MGGSLILIFSKELEPAVLSNFKIYILKKTQNPRFLTNVQITVEDWKTTCLKGPRIRQQNR
jgi:hypothetical protein